MSEQPIRDAPGEPIAFEAYDIGVGPDAPLGANSEYAQAAHRVEAWLEDRARLQRIGALNASYFDRHLAPERLGTHIGRTLSGFIESRRRA